jgi:hypothetical protein
MEKTWNSGFLKIPRGKYMANIKTWVGLMLLVFATILQPVSGQDTLRVVQSFDAEVQSFTSDKLKQIYLITPNQVLRKCTESGKVLFEFSNRYLGRLSKVDASDPFDLLLFYPDYQTILFLDRTLNLTADVRLKTEEFPLPTLVAVGRDRQIWIYDGALNTINQIDRQGTIKHTSQDLSLLLGRRFVPNQMVTNEAGIYLIDPDQGVQVFDFFGQFKNFIPIQGIEQLQNFDQYLLYRQQGEYYVSTQIGLDPSVLKGLPPKVQLIAGLPNWLVVWNGEKVLVLGR